MFCCFKFDVCWLVLVTLWRCLFRWVCLCVCVFSFVVIYLSWCVGGWWYVFRCFTWWWGCMVDIAGFELISLFLIVLMICWFVEFVFWFSWLFAFKRGWLLAIALVYLGLLIGFVLMFLVKLCVFVVVSRLLIADVVCILVVYMGVTTLLWRLIRLRYLGVWVVYTHVFWFGCLLLFCVWFVVSLA